LVAALEAPTFSVARGFYEEPFEVTLSSPTSDVEIRYTTDGSRPTLGTGELYTDAVRIQETIPLQAVAFKQGYVPSPMATHTYLFLADVVRQSTMVQSIVDDPKYSESIFDGLRSIPSVSMVLSDADVQNLQGQSGAEGNKEEVPGSIEMLHSHDRDEFRDFENLQVHCAIEGHSHQQSKRAFRLKFKRAYGPSKLRYPLFASTPISTPLVSLTQAGVYRQAHRFNPLRSWGEPFTRWTGATRVCPAGRCPRWHSGTNHSFR